ncbi:hypothetical protein, partial [Bacillus sp. JJ722]|uniref:hypothetical protein n=1 Tax=Bacillus sp. JJ722 TaxID=3122973 RepID=UPI003000B4A1
MQVDNIRINDLVLISYALDNEYTITQQVISEFKHSIKVKIQNNIVIGYLFLKDRYKIYLYDNNNEIILDVSIKSYDYFILDSFVENFKNASLPDYI